jgi:hypothetical protein
MQRRIEKVTLLLLLGSGSGRILPASRSGDKGIRTAGGLFTVATGLTDTTSVIIAIIKERLMRGLKSWLGAIASQPYFESGSPLALWSVHYNLCSRR